MRETSPKNFLFITDPVVNISHLKAKLKPHVINSLKI